MRTLKIFALCLIVVLSVFALVSNIKEGPYYEDKQGHAQSTPYLSDKQNYGILGYVVYSNEEGNQIVVTDYNKESKENVVKSGVFEISEKTAIKDENGTKYESKLAVGDKVVIWFDENQKKAKKDPYLANNVIVINEQNKVTSPKQAIEIALNEVKASEDNIYWVKDVVYNTRSNTWELLMADANRNYTSVYIKAKNGEVFEKK